MSRPRLITFLTDFGLSDSYVGVMKGAVARVNPRLKVIDLTHDIPPQDIDAASFSLASSCEGFRAGAANSSVVGPGVGRPRRAVAVRIREGFLVGPDNGIFSGVYSKSRPIAAVELTERKFWRRLDPSRGRAPGEGFGNPASTFHGREIFAPVAAFLANGVQIGKFGRAIPIGDLVQNRLLQAFSKNDEIIGVVQYIDRFGNLITNIPAPNSEFPGCDNLPAEFFREGALAKIFETDAPIVKTYSDRKAGEIVALIGSHGFLEISKVNGNARAELMAVVGTDVRLTKN